MTCASLHEKKFTLRLPDWGSSMAVVALISPTFFFLTPYTHSILVLLGLAFYLITAGCTIFRVLISRSAIRMGSSALGLT